MFQNKLVTDQYWQERIPDFSKIHVPVLSAANWGGQSLHSRGNFEGFGKIASTEKWLEVHGLEHWTEFYTNYGVDIQKRFFGYYLKEEKNNWEKEPRVTLQVRYPGDKFIERKENEWPLARTNWTKLYLTPFGSLATEEKKFDESKVEYDGFGEGITFLSEPLDAETEITGPMASKLFVSSETEDADLFLVVRVFTEDLKEVTFKGALDPNTPVGQGWLRASHRKLDPEMSKPYRPYYTHDEIQLLQPNKIYELDVEIWPTSIVIPKNYRIGLTVRGKDYVNQSGGGSTLPNMNKFSGCGPFLHNDPDDRPMDVFGKKVSLHFSKEQRPFLLLPVI